MAKINWHNNAIILLDCYIGNASIEFGKSTAKRWKTEIAAFEERVRFFPESYTPEELLRDKPILYRRRHLMNRRFKLIQSMFSQCWEIALKLSDELGKTGLPQE